MKNNQTKKIFFTITIGVIIFFAVFFIVGYTYVNSSVDNDTISEGIFINNISMGGYTKAEAYEIIDEIVEEIKNNTLTLYYEDYTEEIPYSALEFEIINKEIIDDIFRIGKEGNLLKRYREIKNIEKNTKQYELEINYNEDNIDTILESLKNHFSINPKNAIIQRINNEFVIEEETIGYEFEYEATKEKIRSSILEPYEDVEVELVVNEIIPDYTKAYYEQLKEPIGMFSTSFNINDNQRTLNLKVGSSKITGTLLHPNEVISAIDQLGPINSENGYHPAPIIINGRIEDGVGGGVCQIATTLYNAALLAELEILERSNHSMPVSYIEKGKDAAVATGILDLKIKNSYEFPIYIESYVEGNKLYAIVYGMETRNANQEIVFEPVLIEAIEPPPANIIKDDTLFEGEKIEEQKAIRGYKVKLYKHIYQNGEILDTQLVNNSTYRATPATIRIGTKKQNQNSVTPTSSNPVQNDDLKENQEEKKEIIQEDNKEEDNKREETIHDLVDEILQSLQSRDEEINDLE
ncbi:VanW family protein [Natranaerovirga hydrolytica]|nr:VanW family protein [Natranaerovirga hydrolytica]